MRKRNVRALQSAQFFSHEFGCGDASDFRAAGQNGFRLLPRATKQIAHVWGEERNGNSISQLLRRIGTTEENPMTGKYLIAAALVSACAVAASAQTTTEYYVVQDSATKKCTIVDKKPTTTTMVQVGPMAFKTRTEAEAGMKTITVCSSN